MEIKIVESSDQLYWYSKRIGEVFNVIRIERIDGIVHYWVKTGGVFNTLNFVLESDAEIINCIN